MAVSKTTLKSRVHRKNNPHLSATLVAATKEKHWHHVAQALSGSTRKYSSVNLSDIDKHASSGDTVVVVGKILSMGELTKKVKICALGISESAKEKIKKSKSEYHSLADEIKANPKAEKVKIIK